MHPPALPGNTVPYFQVSIHTYDPPALDESHALAWSAIVAGLLDVALVRHVSDDVVPTLFARVIIRGAVSRVIVFGVGIPLGGRRRCDGVL